MGSGVYGKLPLDLAKAPPDAEQFSPLIPGSKSLEGIRPGSLERFFLLAPPGTIERRYTLALALRALKPGAPFTALAPKDKGGSRVRKELEELGCEVNEESKSHHKICSTIRPENLNEKVDAALQEGAPRFLDEIELWTQPGVFSWNRIDPGSALLLERLPAFKGRGADFGGGLGVLSAAILKSKQVQSLDYFEIDRRSVECAKRNLEDSRVRFHWLDLRSPLSLHAGLDFVVSNPPFHDGGAEDRSLGQMFIRQAAFLLKPGGVCWLVANKHLPYEAEMKTLFSSVMPVVETGGYKIYEARR